MSFMACHAIDESDNKYFETDREFHSSSSDSECNGVESEPEQLGEDEPPSEELLPEQINADKQLKQPKRRCMEVSPVNSGTCAKHGCSGQVVDPKVTPHGQRVNPRVTLSLSAGQTPMQQNHVPVRPKSLNMDSQRNGSESLSAVLGNITNMLGTVIERLDKTESKLQPVERKLNSPSSSNSSAASGADTKRKIPTIIRVSHLSTCLCSA